MTPGSRGTFVDLDYNSHYAQTLYSLKEWISIPLASILCLGLTMTDPTLTEELSLWAVANNGVTNISGLASLLSVWKNSLNDILGNQVNTIWQKSQCLQSWQIEMTSVVWLSEN